MKVLRIFLYIGGASYLELQLAVVGRVGGLKQIPQLLVVDLEVGEEREVARIRARGGGGLEEVLERLLHEAAHRVGLAAAGLPVGEDGAIVALEHGLDDVRADLLVHGLGRGLRAERRVELVDLAGTAAVREAAAARLAVHRHQAL